MMMQVSYFKYTKKSSGRTTDIPDVPVTSPFPKEGIPEPKCEFWIVTRFGEMR